MSNLFNTKRGFTLIEIVVVIAVIGILASVVIANVQSAKMKARDTQRMSDLQNIQVALRIYKDANGTYPSSPTAQVIGVGGSIDAILSPYLPSIPKDPGAGAYVYDSSIKCKYISNTVSHTVLYATVTELPGTGNWGDHPSTPGFCGTINGVGQGVDTPPPTATSYGIRLGPVVL